MIDKGNNEHGFKNELELVNELNNKRIKELNLNLKEFIKFICIKNDIDFSDELLIRSRKETSIKLKQDFYITIQNVEFGVSLKMGSGNSVHQEKCEELIDYLKTTFNASEDICNTFRFFIWGDGTTDGQAPIIKDNLGIVICRFNTTDFKKLYPDKLAILQGFFLQYEKEFLNRFLFEGKNNSQVDYLYHGTAISGRWIDKKSIIDFQIENSNKKTKSNKFLGVGRMSAQIWNTSPKGTKEVKRGVIQLKYSGMQKDLEVLMKGNSNFFVGTFEGDHEELELSHILNKNKNNKLWKIMLPFETDFSNYYVVKVEGNKFSELSKKKVKPKTDAYIIKCNITKSTLLKCEYKLSEDMVENCESYAIKDTGISVKLKSSNYYTIIKLTQTSFYKVFKEFGNDIKFIFAGLLIYNSEKEHEKNNTIISSLNMLPKEFIEYFSSHMGFDIIDFKNTEITNKIRRYCQSIIYKTINSDKKLKEALFTGKHWFKDPYYASYIYNHGKLSKNVYSDFYITTGSGRSRGMYTIELKPKN